ncbi:MAG TPA: TetR/AcrR family transcriptional regulator [Pyrinomonadaceae bacterium]|jgi:AcrR family transcriptional regulator|nr:TetR/AcrR family transcriptional regulator [Pyrinomonadaceae bacterium]
MKAQKKSSPKSAPANERVAEIYRAAAQIILRKGYDATSVNDIANALGMTKAGLYHYINGKKELLFDIMNFGLGELDEEVAEPAKAIEDPAARLRFIVAAHARLVTRGQGAITILVDEITALTPPQQRKITQRKRAYFDFLRGTLDELKKAGKLQDVDTTAAAFSLLGIINWLSRWFRQGGALTDEQAADQIVKIAFHGLLRPEAGKLKAVVSRQ